MKVLSVFFILLFSISSFAEMRTWTSSSGKTLEAELQRVSGTKAYLKRADGKTIPFPISKLSKLDRDFLKSQSSTSTSPAQTAGPKKFSEMSASEARKLKWSDIDTEPAPSPDASPKELSAIKDNGVKWKWAETPHFVIHYYKKTFALRVARMAEFFYYYIGADLEGPEDIAVGKSHIYVFDDGEDWQNFLTDSGGTSWAAAYVRGRVMMLQRGGDSERSSALLAHEMTHLILNRYFKHHPPNWMNEGSAEWYEAFGRSRFKGGGQNVSRTFSDGLSGRYIPLEQLLTMKGYPAQDMIHSFYATSKYFIAFLRITYGDDEYLKFLNQVVMEGKDANAALTAVFGFENVKEILPAFEKFAKLKR